LLCLERHYPAQGGSTSYITLTPTLIEHVNHLEEFEFRGIAATFLLFKLGDGKETKQVETDLA
jgi:hypothetical protein